MSKTVLFSSVFLVVSMFIYGADYPVYEAEKPLQRHIVKISPEQVIAHEQGLFVEFEGQIWRIQLFEQTDDNCCALVEQVNCSEVGDPCYYCRRGYICCENCLGCSNPGCQFACTCRG